MPRHPNVIVPPIKMTDRWGAKGSRAEDDQRREKAVADYLARGGKIKRFPAPWSDPQRMRGLALTSLLGGGE